MTRFANILVRFALTVALILCGVIVAYLAFLRTGEFPTGVVTGFLAAIALLIGLVAVDQGGWNLRDLADDWGRDVDPRFRSFVRIAVYLLMAGVVIAATVLTWALLTHVMPGRAV